MKLFLSKSERIKYLGFDDRCAVGLGIPILAGVAFLMFTNMRNGVSSSYLWYCYLLSVVHVCKYWIALRGAVLFLRVQLPDRTRIGRRITLFLALSAVIVLVIGAISRVTIPYMFPFMVEVGWNNSNIVFDFIVSYTLGIMVAAIYESVYFFTKYQHSVIERERLAKENMQSQLAVLKQQMNPHFLFNSLNTLVNIIPEDSRKATLFTQRLSAVYRRILEWRHKELITLEEEVRALQDYVFLMQTRFEDKLQVCWRFGAGTQVRCEGDGRGIEVPAAVRSYRLVPLSVQLLVENAIKHNVVSTEHPLRIDITLANNRITVSNPLNLRTGRSLDSTGWGHQNLKARYEMVTEDPVEIKSTAEVYEVSIPVFPVKNAVRYATA